MQGLFGGTLLGNIPGYHPSDLLSAYNLNRPFGGFGQPNGTGQTVGIVVAYHDPNAESDLAVYRAKFGLPPCTSASGCFKQVLGYNQTTVAASDQTWGVEESIDVDMVSAICPNCHIMVAEAPSSIDYDLIGAALMLEYEGATVVSNSYGMPDDPALAAFDSYYSHTIPFVAGSGDSGALEWPAVSTHVISVAGTSLTRNPFTLRGWTETPWAPSGSGCSQYMPTVSWQPAFAGCNGRVVADVAAYADPNPGVAVYDTFLSSGAGWRTYGGTSVATPIVAGIIALAGNGPQLTSPGYIYQHRSALYPLVPVGTCTTSLCSPSIGFNATTGLGSPNGTGAF